MLVNDSKLDNSYKSERSNMKDEKMELEVAREFHISDFIFDSKKLQSFHGLQGFDFSLSRFNKFPLQSFTLKTITYFFK